MFIIHFKVLLNFDCNKFILNPKIMGFLESFFLAQLVLGCFPFDWLVIRYSFDRCCSYRGIEFASCHVISVQTLIPLVFKVNGFIIVFVLFKTLIGVKPNETHCNKEILYRENKLCKEESELIFRRLQIVFSQCELENGCHKSIHSVPKI